MHDTIYMLHTPNPGMHNLMSNMVTPTMGDSRNTHCQTLEKLCITMKIAVETMLLIEVFGFSICMFF